MSHPIHQGASVLFTGGGTLGPVTPLLAVARKIHALRRDSSFAWAGTADGPESEIIMREGISFTGVPIAKVPRYPSLRWLTWPREYVRARRIARQMIHDVDPALIVGAGGFTQVPLMHEAHRRRIPCVIHQLDATPTLSNRLVASFCRAVTTSFEYPTSPFGRVKTTRVPTPCRFAGETIPQREDGASYFFLDPTHPIIFAFGGGTGAFALNQAVNVLHTRLASNVQFLHVTGAGRGAGLAADRRTVIKEFMDEKDMRFAYAAADLVICRAGMGTLAELATLRKAAIVIPLPNSHQEANAFALRDGIERIEQRERFEESLERAIRKLLDDPKKRATLGETLHRLLPTDDGSACARICIHAMSR